MVELFGVEIGDVKWTAPTEQLIVHPGQIDAWNVAPEHVGKHDEAMSLSDRDRYRRDPVAWATERVGVELWSKQREIMEAVRDNRRVAVHSCHAVGKGLALDTPLPTPTGWTTMGEVQVGDILYDESGQWTRVTYVSPVRYRPCYRVTFTDGSEITCDDEHLWTILPRSQRQMHRCDARWSECWDYAKTLSAAELAQRDPASRDGVPVAQAIVGVQTELPIPPYWLGAWLGDGHERSLTICAGEQSVEVLERCSALWPHDTVNVDSRTGVLSRRWTHNGSRSRLLRDLGLYRNKHIPTAYLRAPYEDRLELLRGLMDTDGSSGTSCSIGVTSKQLALDIFELVTSLGWRAHWRERTGLKTKNVKRQTLYCVTFSVPRGDPCPFHLQHKVDAWRPCTPKSTIRTIKSIKSVESVPTKCITVDSPRALYLAGRSMIPTHNTFTSALITAWWIDTHPPGTAFVVTTAPTGPQVKALLWREINRLHSSAQLPGRVNLTEWYVGNELVALGRKPSEYNASAFQGIHAMYVLVILDEACGIPKVLWTAAETIASNEHSKILAVGNPDSNDGEFAQKCDPTSGWKTIHIGYRHTPNFTGEAVSEHLRNVLISPTWVEERRLDWTDESALFQSKVEGLFPRKDADPNVVAPLSFVSPCRFLDLPEGEPVEGGIDIGAGGDRTVIVERRGPRVGRVKAFRSNDPMATVGQLVDCINEWGLQRVKVDVIGVGYGLAGRLRELSMKHNPTGDWTHTAEVVGVNFAEKSAYPKRFFNKRAEVWWTIGREYSRLQTWDLSSLDDDAIGELTAPKYEIVDSQGKIKIESKAEVIKRLGRSPDVADALLLAFYTGQTGAAAVGAVDTFRRAPSLVIGGVSNGSSPLSRGFRGASVFPRR